MVKRWLRSYAANTGNRGWSPYGAPWLQPAAISGKSDPRRKHEQAKTMVGERTALDALRVAPAGAVAVGPQPLTVGAAARQFECLSLLHHRLRSTPFTSRPPPIQIPLPERGALTVLIRNGAVYLHVGAMRAAERSSRVALSA